jgi:hypothetical protein
VRRADMMTHFPLDTVDHGTHHRIEARRCPSAQQGPDFAASPDVQGR